MNDAQAVVRMAFLSARILPEAARYRQFSYRSRPRPYRPAELASGRDMFALSTAASIALGGMFWAWSLHGGDPVMAPRAAARLFGWLCMACTSVGLYFALRGHS